MKNRDRDLLVLLKHGLMSKWAIDKEVECLNEILQRIESSPQFYKVYELVDRNYISSNSKKILKAVRLPELKAFRFLINKN